MFEFAGKVICRKAGSAAGNLLRGWRQARDQDPSLFRQISLMSQPSANVDGIIFSWAQEELASLAPASVHVHDCFAAAWSVSEPESLFYSQSLQTVIGPKLTASLQLTDTDFARSFKSLARSAMDDLRLAVCSFFVCFPPLMSAFHCPKPEFLAQLDFPPVPAGMARRSSGERAIWTWRGLLCRLRRRCLSDKTPATGSCLVFAATVCWLTDPTSPSRLWFL